MTTCPAPGPPQIFRARNKHLTLGLVRRVVDDRESNPEGKIRDAVGVLREDLPRKLRPYEDIAVRAFLGYVDPKDPFPLVFGAGQVDRRDCRDSPRIASRRWIRRK